MLAASRSESVAEAEEVLLVDDVQHRRRRSLDDFVLQRGDRQRTLPLRPRNIDPRARLRPLCSPQVRELARSSSESTVIWCRSAVNFFSSFFLPVWRSVTSRVRSLPATAPNLSDTDWRGGESCPARHEISWFPDTQSLRTTLGASTTPDQRGARGDAPARFAFRSVNSVGVQNRCLSRLDGWPMRPYRCFEAALTDKPARLGFNAGES